MEIHERLDALRKEMEKEGIDVYYFNTSDYHMSEYVPEYFRTIAYFSGFRGSLATLLVDMQKAVLFVDGRYHLQADQQSGIYGIEIVKLGNPGALSPLDYLSEHYAGKRLGIDGKRTSLAFAKELQRRKISFVSRDIYSSLITDRAPFPASKAHFMPEEYTGKSRREKLREVFYCLGGKTHIINSPEAVCYLLNIRGNDIVHTPVILSYLVLTDNEAYLFADLERFDEEMLDELYADGVIIRPYDSYYSFLSNLSGRKILLDENKVNYETWASIKALNRIYPMRSVVDDMKSIKNPVEQEGFRRAHIYDGVTMLRFIKWLKETDLSTYTEYDVAMKLDSMRRAYHADDISFTSIVGYNENAAVVHYAPEEGKAKKLENRGILLVDSGGQYPEGTTDITRTIAIGDVDPEMRVCFTAVLKAMLNISGLTFLKGTTGRDIDILARKELWERGLNYLHGTGHGVGHVLSVHEGPPSIRSGGAYGGNECVPFREGNVVSDEPGVYLSGKYGFRCENLLLVQKKEVTEWGTFLHFETLTLVPFDLDLVDRSCLDEASVRALNAYHKRVRETISPYLNDEERDFLNWITREIV